MPDFDLAIIGAGSAGLSVALIERAQMGGECLNTGGVPSKALLAAAHAARAARRAARTPAAPPRQACLSAPAFRDV